MSKRSRTAFIATAVSLAALGGAAAVVLSWRGILPDPIAVHWGINGSANGFSSVGSFVAVILAVFGSTICLFALLSVAAGLPQSPSRIMTGAIIYMGFTGASIMLATTAIQRGASQSLGTFLPGWVLLGALALPLIPAIIAGFIVGTTPIADAAAPPPKDLPHAQLVSGKVQAWRGSTRARPVTFTSVEVLVLLSLIPIAFVTRQWSWVLLAFVLAAGLSLGLAYKIVADERGLIVSSWPGWPSKRIHARQIESADVTEVSPLGDFGGWGFRMGVDGTEGIVTRKGQGIRVSYGQGRALVVTVDKDALGAAATLNAAAQQAFEKFPPQK